MLVQKKNQEPIHLSLGAAEGWKWCWMTPQTLCLALPSLCGTSLTYPLSVWPPLLTLALWNSKERFGNKKTHRTLKSHAIVMHV